MRKRIPIYFLLILLFPVGLLMLFSGSIVQIKGAMKYRQQGPLVKDFAAEKIPDNENAAIIYAQAFQEMPTATADKDGEILSKFLRVEEREKDSRLWDEVQVMLPEYDKSLTIVEKAVLRSKCQFPFNWKDPIMAELSHQPKLRRLVMVLCANALIDARAGRMDEACHSLLLGLNVADALRDNPPTLSTPLMRSALIKIVCRTLRELPMYGELNELQTSSFLQALAKIDIDRTFVRTMEGGRAIHLWAFDRIRKNPSIASKWSGASSESSGGQESKSSKPVIWLAITWKDEALYDKCIEDQLAVTHMRYREAKLKGLLDEPKLPSYALMSAMFLPVPKFWAATRDSVVAEIGGTSVFLDLNLHRNRSGSYPTSLKDIGKKLPKDPFSGKPFIYKRQGKGFLLYSIGPDLKDDGGKQTPRDPNAGDILWKMDK